MSRITCRTEPVSDADAERLANLRVEAMRPSLEAVGRFDPVRARERFLDGFVAADTCIIQVEGSIAGFLVVRRRADHFYLDHLYVSPAFQGRGIGRDIIEGLKAEANAAGLPIRLMALNGSPANAFYLSCGFRFVSQDALDTIYIWTPGA
ncbi:GNAT family N-acetyltransferase [Roseibium sp. FZY0029]|uniref:GNAT family N-acetyltransferase n=1 Tax=Roseibium sp. FZY0029 TaxID=3116647 RepID=UPI002EB5EA0F|nr:GNAT family N-acetyltransferase [Roseibium sp. FZY0029]